MPIASQTRRLKRAEITDSFEQWKNRPVYLAQCRTYAKALSIGLGSAQFRLLPPYRNERVIAERDQVAQAIRQDRKTRS